MKKIFLLLAFIVCITVLNPAGLLTPSHAASGTKVVVDGVVVHFNNQDYVEDQTLWLPVKPLAQSLGFKLKWHADTEITELTQPYSNVKIIPRKQQVEVDGLVFTLPSTLEKGTLFVPFERFMQHVDADKFYAKRTDTWYVKSALRTKIAKGLASPSLVYSGGELNGEAHGEGTYRLQGGLWYEGDFRQGSMEGQGKLYDGGRLVYEGTFKNDLPHGKGIFYYANGNVYEGEFKDGTMHGNGVVSFQEQMLYKGYWANGKMDGKGYLFGPDEALVYEGEFKSNQRYGFGVEYDDSNQIVYEGYWRNDQRHGQGRSYYESGMVKYEGEWLENKENGKGTFYSYTIQDNNQDHTNGTFNDEPTEDDYRISPEDMILNKDKERANVKTGIFKDGNLVELDQDLIYYGGFLNGVSEKYGWLYKNDKLFTFSEYFNPNYDMYDEDEEEEISEEMDRLLVYEGGFHRGLKHGFGTEYDNESIVYHGEYEQGRREGSGWAPLEDGLIYSGKWKNNKPDGKGFLYRNNKQDPDYSGFGHAYIREVEYDDGKLINELKQYKYIGEFKHGVMHGTGITYQIVEDRDDIDADYFHLTKLSSGEQAFKYYEGTYVNGLKETTGYTPGRLYYYGKLVYEGEWYRDQKHGTGTEFDEKYGYRIYSGTFEEGERHGEGTLYSGVNRIKFVGEFEKGKKHGEGTEYEEYPNTKLYEGEYEYGNRHGVGTIFENGSVVYEGNFKEGKKHGYGIIYWFGEVEYAGEFIEDMKAEDYYDQLEKDTQK